MSVLHTSNNKIRRSAGEVVFSAFNMILLAFFSLLTTYPMLYVVYSSLSEGAKLSAHRGLLLWPQGFDTSAFAVVLKNNLILTGYRNTLIILVLGVILNVIMTSICAYFLSRSNLPLQKIFSRLIIFTMFFSGGLVPSYLVVQTLNLYNTLWALIFPGAMSTYNMLIMRSYFLSIPRSLEEAAKIDGAGHVRILLKVILPVSMPVVAVMILYYGVGHWNSWFNAMIYIRNKELYPLQLVLRDILIRNKQDELISSEADRAKVSDTIKYATIVVSTLPILCIYPFLQKYFVSGLTIGAVKG